MGTSFGGGSGFRVLGVEGLGVSGSFGLEFGVYRV